MKPWLQRRPNQPLPRPEAVGNPRDRLPQKSTKSDEARRNCFNGTRRRAARRSATPHRISLRHPARLLRLPLQGGVILEARTRLPVELNHSPLEGESVRQGLRPQSNRWGANAALHEWRATVLGRRRSGNGVRSGRARPSRYLRGWGGASSHDPGLPPGATRGRSYAAL